MKLKNILKPSWAISVTEYSNPVKIISYAAISSSKHVGGRLVPLVVVDASDRPELDELVRVHEYLPPGDVTVTWGQRDGLKNEIVLRLEFIRPLETTIHMEFDIVKFGGFVDQIFSTRVLYFMTGREGDHCVDREVLNKIFIEIPDTGFFEIWDEMFRKNTIKRMRQNGLGRQESKRGAREYIENWREFGSYRA